MKEERKQPRWEESRSILHETDREEYQAENAYGILKYAGDENAGRRPDRQQRKRRTGGDRNSRGEKQEGFVLEAKEAPGTPAHTEREKKLDPDHMKQSRIKSERHLYASELPLKNQAVFYNISEWRRSDDFLECLKELIRSTGHTTVKNMLGFLDQEGERAQMERLMEMRRGELSAEQFGEINRQIDTLNDRLLKKKSKESEMCTKLQLMIDRREEGKNRVKADDWKLRCFTEGELKEAEAGNDEESGKNEEDEEKNKKKDKK